MRKILILICALVAFSMAGTLKDSRDGKTYKTVKIGDQVWMAENLNYKTSESKCYDNKESNCKKYGRLYTWEAAKKACPDGWHLPTDFGGDLLDEIDDGHDSRNLRAGSWDNGGDKYGFSALPAGYYYSYGKEFRGLGRTAYFWGSDDCIDGVCILEIHGDSVIINEYGVGEDGFVVSVRCQKD